MSLIVDFLLLAASGAACFYCWFLSKKLKALMNTEDGFQNGIAALSQSAEDMKAAMADTHDATDKNVARLEQLLAESEQRIPEVQSLLVQINEVSNQAVDETEGATKKLVDTITPHIIEAREAATALLTVLEGATAVKEIRTEEQPAENSPSAQEILPALDEAEENEEDVAYIAIDENDIPENSEKAAGEAA